MACLVSMARLNGSPEGLQDSQLAGSNGNQDRASTDSGLAAAQATLVTISNSWRASTSL